MASEHSNGRSILNANGGIPGEYVDGSMDLEVLGNPSVSA